MVTFLAVIAGTTLGLLGLPSRVLPSARDRLLAGALGPCLLASVGAFGAATGWPRSTWLPLLILAGICAALRLARSSLASRLLAWAARPSVQACSLVLAAAAVVFWSSQQAEPDFLFDDGQQQPSWRPAAIRTMASLRPDLTATAVTDENRAVRLLTPAHALEPETLEAMEREMASQWSLKIIRTAPPDARSDCHGWVFADGGWWVLGADVEMILDDNHYEPVEEPQAGDLVVYRQGPETITHSGIVYAVAESGVVLVESKWSWLGTYLHAPDVHPYGGVPVYYRSSRDGHRVKVSESSL